MYIDSLVTDAHIPPARAAQVEPFTSHSRPAVRGFLHLPRNPSGDALVLTHGAGSNCNAQLLVAVSGALAEAGFIVLRCDLPFRQVRPHGPPVPGGSAQDREGLRKAVDTLRSPEPGGLKRRLFLGGHSYGGRQATILAASCPGLVNGLLLLSYPLHPPRQPASLRTAHFPDLRTPALFIHGSRDPFGTLEEMRSALSLIPAATSLLAVEGAGHDLNSRRAGGAWLEVAAKTFRDFVGE